MERAVDGRVGLGGPGVVARGRKCVDIFAIDSRDVDCEDAGVARRMWVGPNWTNNAGQSRSTTFGLERTWDENTNVKLAQGVQVR